VLSFEAVAELLARIAPAGAVRVGGQALNYWTTVFRAAPDLNAYGPFVSQDVDLQGNRAQVAQAAELLNVVALYPKPDDATTASGLVKCTLSGGREVVVDFLSAVLGLAAGEVVKSAIMVQLGDATIRVMHPVQCLESRVHNVAVLPPSTPTVTG
jgi:hypothetical protein